MIVVQVEDLRTAANKVLDHVLADVGADIELSQDFFWSVPSQDLFNMELPPAMLTVGQISESLEFLKSGGSEARLAYELVWLADILRAVGAQVVR